VWGSGGTALTFFISTLDGVVRLGFDRGGKLPGTHLIWRHAVAQWLKQYATGWKVASSSLDEVNSPEVHSSSNRNGYQKQKK
jgi:hypothetical protein